MTAETRLATLGDTEALARVAAETFPLACPTGLAAKDMDDFIAENLSEARFEGYLTDPFRTILVATEGATVVGYSMLRSGEPEDVDARAAVRLRPTTELEKFFLAATSHGDGTAGLLMAASLEVAMGWDSRSVWLGVGRENVRANRFYEKQGFVMVGTKAFRVGERVFEHDIVRERPLPADGHGLGERRSLPSS